MPILTTDREQYELQEGSNGLGGTGAGAVRLSDLATLPSVCTITVTRGAPATILRLTPRIVVRLNGETLGGTPRELSEGARIDIGRFRFTYSEQPADTTTGTAQPRQRPKQSELATQVLSSITSPFRPARLVSLTTGHAIAITDGAMVVGRGEESDLVLEGEGLSRRHALIQAEGPGYTITDKSSNGTFVNGERVTEVRPLQAGDIIAFCHEQYRFDFIGGSDATPEAGGATVVVGETRALAPPMAQLEVTRGIGGRVVHRIERPVCVVGRDRHNDVHIAHESVSGAHATLLRKRDTWYITDLRSVNGTYVDGYRVAGERALAPGCTIRVGEVDMIFQPNHGVGDRPIPTQMSGGFFRRLTRALSASRD